MMLQDEVRDPARKAVESEFRMDSRVRRPRNTSGRSSIREVLKDSAYKGMMQGAPSQQDVAGKT
ncbi:hypothetical protein [Photobacterium sp. 1_MG-2023]|uniref:hypothetical protein n=1 Tax=Photobacterium sp. 1_MG-2023 TaxID=3062646 RepID=UPI0026E3BF56|nr:hypothetical protein [Photobacterium sp. 1_MG-2023]MDO6707790.1 hypothetical protein [Photobacterium sp. 1_MG-2023]